MPRGAVCFDVPAFLEAQPRGGLVRRYLALRQYGSSAGAPYAVAAMLG
jgi:hypothetical protein